MDLQVGYPLSLKKWTKVLEIVYPFIEHPRSSVRNYEITTELKKKKVLWMEDINSIPFKLSFGLKKKKSKVVKF